MKDILTIVIPCKNENKNIYDCIEHISKQKSIEGATVVIADNSDSDDSINWLYKTKYDFMDKLQIKVIKGGYPSKARLEGSKLVSTPYVLFIDADVLLTESNILESISLLDFDLVTTTFSTEKNWNWVFRTFDIFQKISIVLGTPFAIGGFQYWKTKKYWELGGFDPEEMIAEDYRISSKCNKHSFKIYKTSGVYTSARRFKNKGILYMFIIMIKSYINRNNPEFFKKHHNYWK